MLKKGWLIVFPALLILGMGVTPLVLVEPALAQPAPAINPNDQDENDEYNDVEDFGQDEDEGQDLPLNPNNQEAAPVQAVPPSATPQQVPPPPPPNSAPGPNNEGGED